MAAGNGWICLLHGKGMSLLGKGNAADANKHILEGDGMNTAAELWDMR
jgi:hypothetical protein